MNKFYDYWEKWPNSIKYDNDEIINFIKNEENRNILKTIGLPLIETNYLKFYPIKKLLYVEFNDTEYLLIGSPFQFYEVPEDNFILIDVVTQKVLYYSSSLYKIGLLSSEISYVNKDLDTFFYFLEEFVKFIRFFLESPQLKPFGEAKKSFINFREKLVLTNDLKLEIESYWRKRFFELMHDIEEKYNQFLS